MTEGLERWRKWAAARMRAGLAWYRARHAAPRDVFAGDNSQYIGSSRRHGLLIVAYGLVGAQLAWDESQRGAAAALYGYVEKILWSALRRSRTSPRGRGPGTGRRPWLRDRFDGIPTGRRCSWRWPVGSARWSPVSVRRGDDRLAAPRGVVSPAETGRNIEIAAEHCPGRTTAPTAATGSAMRRHW